MGHSLRLRHTQSQRTSDTHTADDTRIDTHLVVQHNTDSTAQHRHDTAQPSHSLFVYIKYQIQYVLCTKDRSLAMPSQQYVKLTISSSISYPLPTV